MGAGVSLFGASLTVALNIYWIPTFGYTGSAYATLVCYAAMAILSYALGQKFYRVDYDVKSVLGYLVLGIGLYLTNVQLQPFLNWKTGFLATDLMGLYLLVVMLFESKSFRVSKV
jgi:O-antigen/teichoic acid export membrane protein